MDDEMRSAASPRWRGKAGRLEVWYATAVGSADACRPVDPLRDGGAAARPGRLRARLGDLVSTRRPTVHRAVRPGARPTRDRHRLVRRRGGACRARRADRTRRVARHGTCRWKDSGTPLWTFPRAAWERELLPGAQVVLAPTADFTGSLTVGDTAQRVDGWRGGVAHIYGHGNAKRWGWIHADLGDGDVVEAVTAVSHKPGLRRLAPMAFVRFRIDGKDWPASLLPSLRMRTTLGLRHWQLEGRIGGRDVLIRVDQPPDRCVSLGYTDPDGGTAVCTNTEQADVHVEISHRERGARVIEHSWSVQGTGHAEVGLRGAEAPAVNERTPT